MDDIFLTIIKIGEYYCKMITQFLVACYLNTRGRILPYYIVYTCVYICVVVWNLVSIWFVI